MDIKFPDSRCEESPDKAHYFTKLVGSIWRCRHCWSVKWLPTSWDGTLAFSVDISRIGLDRAYRRHLQDKPNTRQILRKLEKMRLLRKVLPYEEAMIAMAAIVTEKELEDDLLKPTTGRMNIII